MQEIIAPITLGALAPIVSSPRNGPNVVEALATRYEVTPQSMKAYLVGHLTPAAWIEME